MKHLLLFYIVILSTFMQVLGQNKSTTPAKKEDPEYSQYKYLADFYFKEGNYAKATKLYKSCLLMPGHDNDSYVNQQLAVCNEIQSAFQKLDDALVKNQGDVKAAMNEIKDVQQKNRGNDNFKLQVISALENEADRRIKIGQYEAAFGNYVMAYEIDPLQRLIFKIEQANKSYEEKNNKPINGFIEFENKIKGNATSQSSVVATKKVESLTAEQEYAKYKKSADIAFEKGNYEAARKLYNASLQVPGYEKNPISENRIIDCAKIIALLKNGMENNRQGNFGQAAESFKKILDINPQDTKVTTFTGQALEKFGDVYLTKQLYEEAQQSFESALKYTPSETLKTKLAQVNKKITDLQKEKAKQEKENSKNLNKIKKEKLNEPDKTTEDEVKKDKAKKENTVIKEKQPSAKELARLRKQAERDALRKKRREAREARRAAKRKPKKIPKIEDQDPAKDYGTIDISEIVGVTASLGTHYTKPQLSNNSGQVASRGGMGLNWGGQMIFLPKKAISLLISVQGASQKFYSMNLDKSGSIENFKYRLLQIPISLRYSREINEDGLRFFMQGGAVYNKPRTLKYSNHSIGLTDIDALSTTNPFWSYQVGIGFSKDFNKHQSAYLQVYYQGAIGNLLNTSYTDAALNRSTANVFVSNIGLQLILKIF